MEHVIFEQCVGFEWDEGNAVKSWRKHTVSQIECEEIFFNLPLVVERTGKHSNEELRYYALGHTDEWRLLFLVFTVRQKKVRVISARPMSRKERSIYEAQSA